MKIEKKVEINRNHETVFNYLKITKNQDNFSVWNMADPSMNKNYKGTDGTIGFVYSWDSTNKNVGSGEQEITDIAEGKSIDYRMRFYRPMKNTGSSGFHVTPLNGTKTIVRWSFESPSKFPMILFAPVFKKMLGKDLEKGLNNLKVILEKN